MPAQAYPCPCGGSNDYCGCQDFQRVEVVTADHLLDWLTHHHLPLQVWRECEDDGGSWVVVDASNDTVLASGGCAQSALAEAYRKSTKPDHDANGEPGAGPDGGVSPAHHTKGPKPCNR